MNIGARSAILLFLLTGQNAASALDIMPGDYLPAPAGTNVIMGYGSYGTASSLRVDGVGKIADSKLSTLTGTARFIHFDEVAGMPVAVQALVPNGMFTDARIGGIHQRRENGLVDTTVAVVAWPINTTGPYGTALGIAAFVTMPTGAYSPRANTVSMGNGTWAFTPEIGIVQGLGGKLFFEAAIDTQIRADHTELGQRLSRGPSTQLQALFRYQFTEATSFSVGYSSTYGGRTTADGVPTGNKARSDQVRVFASTMLTPTLQLQGMIGRDVYAAGGFKQDFNGQIRLTKVFAAH